MARCHVRCGDKFIGFAAPSPARHRLPRARPCLLCYALFACLRQRELRSRSESVTSLSILASAVNRCLAAERIRRSPMNDTHQRAGARCVDFKTDPTAGSVACDSLANLSFGLRTEQTKFRNFRSRFDINRRHPLREIRQVIHRHCGSYCLFLDRQRPRKRHIQTFAIGNGQCYMFQILCLIAAVCKVKNVTHVALFRISSVAPQSSGFPVEVNPLFDEFKCPFMLTIFKKAKARTQPIQQR